MVAVGMIEYYRATAESDYRAWVEDIAYSQIRYLLSIEGVNRKRGNLVIEFLQDLILI